MFPGVHLQPSSLTPCGHYPGLSSGDVENVPVVVRLAATLPFSAHQNSGRERGVVFWGEVFCSSCRLSSAVHETPLKFDPSKIEIMWFICIGKTFTVILCNSILYIRTSLLTQCLMHQYTCCSSRNWHWLVVHEISHQQRITVQTETIFSA